jgi:hypothetical protein
VTFKPKRRDTPAEQALAIMTEMYAMMRDMHGEIQRMAFAERKARRAAGKKGAPAQPEPPAKDDREFDDEGDE